MAKTTPAADEGPADEAVAPVTRPAVPADADAVRTLVNDAYGHYVARIGKPPGPMRDDYDRRIAAGQVWVLEPSHGGEILGIVVLEEQADALLLDNVAVSPTAQGKGHGRALIAFAEAECARRGFDELRLYTHALMTENIALYTRLGFAEIGHVQEKGFDRIYMAKRPRRFETVPNPHAL
jgi:ribosomal protein S18 acetylase RimI-like enzyme